MAKLIGFKNLGTDSEKVKKGQVLILNPKWSEKSKEPKYIKADGAYVYDGKLWQVAQFTCEDGSYMVPQYEK